MASHDVRDVLNLPLDNAARPAKKQKTNFPRPSLKGLAREVQNLGGDNPIAIVPELSTFKKRRFGSRKPAAKWELRPFRNSARDDQSLCLRHWRKRTEDQTRTQESQNGETGTEQESKTEQLDDSTFAKFNVQVDIPQYSDDQYYYLLTSIDWTKDETDYLFGLVRAFDLRWPLIWDRYEYQPKLPEKVTNGEGPDSTDPSTAVVPAPKVRTLEDLKARYYEVAARMMAVQKPVQYMTQPEFALHEVMANFNPAAEAQRKKFAADAMSRSRDEAQEEELLLIEVRRILARQERLNQERRELYNRLDYPQTEQDINAFKSSAGLQTLLQNLMNVDKTKKRKSLMEANGVNTPASAHPSGHPNSTPISETRRESIAASTSGHRDSIGGSERPERPAKKGAQPERRKLSEQEEQIYGVSYHDRLPSGPTFRYERINKILTTKSNAQHQRITNTLAELDIPSRLNMPTRAVVEEMEKLLSSIGLLLDMRKMSDKIDAEIRLAEARKAEREKAMGIFHNNNNNKTESEFKAPAPAGEKGIIHGDAKKGEGEGAAHGGAVQGDSADAGAAATAEKSNGDGPATNGAATNGDVNGNSTAVSGNGVSTGHSAGDKSARPNSSSSNGRKRSMSVLSATSDKSSKRQKK
ncbi:emp24p/erv25p- protein [Hypoxylon texense]